MRTAHAVQIIDEAARNRLTALARCARPPRLFLFSTRIAVNALSSSLILMHHPSWSNKACADNRSPLRLVSTARAPRRRTHERVRRARTHGSPHVPGMLLYIARRCRTPRPCGVHRSRNIVNSTYTNRANPRARVLCLHPRSSRLLLRVSHRLRRDPRIGVAPWVHLLP